MTFRSGILIQARMSSSRLPGKMLMRLGGVPLVEFVYRRCLTAVKADTVAILTSEQSSDDILHDYCLGRDIPVYRGPLDNVLQRYIEAAEFYDIQLVCRVCGDSPFVDTAMIDKMIAMMPSQNHDYIAPENCIDGFFAEVVQLSALRHIAANNATPESLEHVTHGIRHNPGPYKICRLNMEQQDLAKEISLTVDTAADLRFCNSIATYLLEKYGGNKFDFSTREIIAVIKKLRNKVNFHASSAISQAN